MTFRLKFDEHPVEEAKLDPTDIVTPMQGQFHFPDHNMPGSQDPSSSNYDSPYSTSEFKSQPHILSRQGSDASMISIPPRHIPALHTPASSQLSLKRYDSISSVCTTDDDDDEVYPETQYIWNNRQDEILKTMFDEYTSNPTNTPFAPGKPPSGVVQRVSRAALKRATFLGCEFPHNIGAIRKRLLWLCSEDVNEQAQKYSWLTDGEVPGQILDEKMPLANRRHPVTTNHTMDQFDSNEDRTRAPPSLSPIRTATEKVYRESSVYPENASVFEDSLELSSPFKESFAAGAAVSLGQATSGPEPPVIGFAALSTTDGPNIMTKRKRDSLRLKRGLK